MIASFPRHSLILHSILLYLLLPTVFISVALERKAGWIEDVGMTVRCWLSTLFTLFSHSQFAFQLLSPQFFLFHFVAQSENNIYLHPAASFSCFPMLWGRVTGNSLPDYTLSDLFSDLVFEISILCFPCFQITSRKWDRYEHAHARASDHERDLLIQDNF